MASFGGIDLQLSTGGGAVFAITPDTDDLEFNYPAGTRGEVLLPHRSHNIIVRGLQTRDHATTLATARESANRALDIAFGQGRRPVLLKHRDSPYVAWWPTGHGTTLTVVATLLSTARMSATFEVRDSTGKLVESPPPPPKTWHESLRYYRVSESSNDLYDSFRNLYLALESILSTMVPPHTNPSESEGRWLERALKTVAVTLDLAPFAPSNSMKSASNAIHEELYTNLRTAIFHAKAGRKIWLPQDWNSRQTITEARVRYSTLFRKLAQAHLDIPYPGGGFVKTFWEEVMDDPILNDSVAYVSNDQTAVADEPKGEYQIAPAGGQVLQLPTTTADDLHRDWCRGIRGTATGQGITDVVGTIQRFGVLREGQLAMVENLPEPLSVEDAHQVDVVFLMEGRNYGAPRQDFDT
ncbi:MAG: hypothetical protein L0H41_16135 [Microlunatus sp.]|nr:hypothetical protein [Microlunatus sp.]